MSLMSAVVVVGVDGSAEAAEASEYAAVEAALCGAQLRVVTVFPLPEYWSVPVGFLPPAVPAPSWDLQSAAQEQAQSAVDALSAARPDLVRQIEIEPLGVCGRPTDELVEQEPRRRPPGTRPSRSGRGGQRGPGIGGTGLRAARAMPGHDHAAQQEHHAAHVRSSDRCTCDGVRCAHRGRPPSPRS
jgi:nucleotide-binding universal stress UspA family protein